MRDPIFAHFETADGFKFVLAAVYLKYEKSVAERAEGALTLRSCLVWLNESFEGNQAFFAGDFNLPPTNPVLSLVSRNAAPLISVGGTTRSSENGLIANLYDNLGTPRGVSLPIQASGRLEFPNQVLGVTHA